MNGKKMAMPANLKILLNDAQAFFLLGHSSSDAFFFRISELMIYLHNERGAVQPYLVLRGLSHESEIMPAIRQSPSLEKTKSDL
jgi:hypothetical protein